MKNRMRNILYIFIVTVISILGITTVYAKTGEKITLTKKTYTNFVGARREAKFYTSLGYAWCITPEKKGADEGATLTYVKDETDGGLLYLIDNTKTDDKSYQITQVAMWLYYNNFMPESYNKYTNTDFIKSAKALANEAKNHKNYSTTPAIKIVINNNVMSLVKENNTYYYVSKELSANVTNAQTYSISLENAPKGTVILNSNNKEVTSLNSGEKFKIRVPEANVTSKASIRVIVSATGTKKYIERYRPTNTTKQDLVLMRSENMKVTSSTDLSITPETRVCEVFNGKYYGEDGKIVDKDTYNKQCNHVCEVYKGKYYGEDGKETTKEKYKEQCEHVCEVYKGKYYGEDGKETTKEKYKEQCEHVCEVYKGKYFDSFGNETTLEEYTKQCKHICEVNNGKYYGKNGDEVDKDTYDSECNPPTVIVPPTGTNKMPMGLYLLIGFLPIVGGTSLILKTKKEN